MVLDQYLIKRFEWTGLNYLVGLERRGWVELTCWVGEERLG